MRVEQDLLVFWLRQCLEWRHSRLWWSDDVDSMFCLNACLSFRLHVDLEISHSWIQSASRHDFLALSVCIFISVFACMNTLLSLESSTQFFFRWIRIFYHFFLSSYEMLTAGFKHIFVFTSTLLHVPSNVLGDPVCTERLYSVLVLHSEWRRVVPAGDQTNTAECPHPVLHTVGEPHSLTSFF